MTAPDSKPALLRMRGISKSFPGVRALQDVDFEVGPAEIHAFLGENGAGKSTLLKILSGAQPPDSGTIEFDGRSVSFASPHEAQVAVNISRGPPYPPPPPPLLYPPPPPPP